MKSWRPGFILITDAALLVLNAVGIVLRLLSYRVATAALDHPGLARRAPRSVTPDFIVGHRHLSEATGIDRANPQPITARALDMSRDVAAKHLRAACARRHQMLEHGRDVQSNRTIPRSQDQSIAPNTAAELAKVLVPQGFL